MENNLRCNMCGKVIKEERGILREDIYEGKKEWGYYSKKDLMVDTFYLCEVCYDRWVKSFIIPVERKEKNEVL